MKSLSKSDIKMDDYRHVEMYDDYCQMVDNGHKVEYVLAVLREKYGMSESTIRRVLSRMYRPVKPWKGEKAKTFAIGILAG